MNAFGNFAGNIDMQNISDGIGGFAEGLATLTDIGDKANLDGIFSALGTGFSGFTKVAEGAGTALSRAFAPIAQGAENAFNMGSWIKDNILGGNETVNVEGPSIELNPNISVADAKQAEIAKGILDNVDGKSFGSADAAERIISDLNNDVSKLEVKPEVKGILDQNTIAKNVNSENIGKLLQSRIGKGEENAIEIPIQTAMDIETAAGKDGLNVQDSIKDQLSKLTGIAVEDLNIEVGVGTTFKVAKNADGSLGDLIKGSIDDTGNLSIEVVATANVVAQIAGVTGLDGAALDSALGGIFDGQTISQELAVQIKANMGLADSSMADFESALEGKLAGINGQNYDVILNADGTVNITIKDPVVPNIPAPAPLPDLTMQQKATIALQFDMKYTEFGSLTEQLKSLALPGGESVEITQQMQVNLEAVVGGGSPEEVQGKIRALIAGLTGMSVEQVDVVFGVNAIPQPNPATPVVPIEPIPEVRPNSMGPRNLFTPAMFETEPVTPTVEVIPNVVVGADGFGAGMKGVASSLETAIGGDVKITPQIDTSQLSQGLGAITGIQIPPIKVPISIDPGAFALGLGSIASVQVPPIRIPVTIDPGAFALGLGSIASVQVPPIRIPVVLDTSGLGAIGIITIPPIRVPIIIDPPIIPSIAVPMLRGTITYDAIIPPITIPNTTSTHTILINNPGLPSFPNTTSTHSIIMNVPSMPSFPNTSSTHTINVVVNGSTSIGGGGGAARAGALAANPLARGIAPMSMGSIGAMGASGGSRGGNEASSLYSIGESISLSVADGISAGIPSVISAGNALSSAAFDSIAGNFSNIAFENGKATALGYVDGIMSQYGIATTAGARLGNNVLAGAKFNGIFTNEVGKQVAEIMKFFGNGIGKIIFEAVGAIPFVGPLLQIAGILFGQFAQAAAYNSSPYAKGVSNYYYYHYETTNNSFDGGLIGDPESQARKVLDVLEQSPSTRRIRKVFDQ